MHSDLAEYPQLSYHKHKYVIVFVDDFTGFSWSELLKTKDAAFGASKRFLAMCSRQFPQYQVRHWMSDSGGEYTSARFQSMLQEEGIQHVRTTPYTHQQNGRAERFIRTMCEKSEAMRHEACLPESHWEFALEYAVHFVQPHSIQTWVVVYTIPPAV